MPSPAARLRRTGVHVVLLNSISACALLRSRCALPSPRFLTPLRLRSLSRSLRSRGSAASLTLAPRFGLEQSFVGALPGPELLVHGIPTSFLAIAVVQAVRGFLCVGCRLRSSTCLRLEPWFAGVLASLARGVVTTLLGRTFALLGDALRLRSRIRTRGDALLLSFRKFR